MIMCSSLERADTFRIKTRLFPSQQSASQILTTALGNCNLASQQQDEGDVIMTQTQERDGSETATLCTLPSCSTQDGGLVSQDFNTPADQQYENEVNPQDTGRHMRSPAALSPGRCKRVKRVLGERQGSSNSQCSTSQKPPMPPETGANCGGFCPPSAQPGRKLLKRRVRSPPVSRNIFMDGPEDADHPALGPRALPAVSRYRMEYKEIEPLGHGNFSKVFRVRCRFDGGEYAIKRSARPVIDLALRTQWQQEAMAMLASGVHPSIVRYFGAWTEACEEGHHFYILMERCEESLGTKLMFRGTPFQEAELLDILRQMAEALQHLHGRGIIHMDVKPDNIYRCHDGSVKLGDFGLATTRAGRTSITATEGDARYLAPELLKDNLEHLEKADIFALGASLYELALGTTLPTGGPGYEDMRNAKLKLLPGYTTQFQTMLKALLAPRAVDRPTAKKILTSSLLAKRPTSTYAELPFLKSSHQ